MISLLKSHSEIFIRFPCIYILQNKNKYLKNNILYNSINNFFNKMEVNLHNNYKYLHKNILFGKNE
jgi:hypothetical protein